MRQVKQENEDAAIRVRALRKNYGPLHALDDVSFTVRAGELFGYLGPNGAGKTTTINILSGLLRRDAGDVAICGRDVARDPVAVKQRIGVVPEESNLYPELSCRRNLEYLGELYGLSRADRRARTAELLQRFGLGDRAATPFRALSRGLKRRLTVAAALIHSPEVIFLDEPTAGLDVPSARALRALIKTLHADGATVFLTTHNLSEAESLCDRVLILVKGHVVADGTAEEIRQRVETIRKLSVTFSGDVPERALREACPAIPSAALSKGTWHLEVSGVHEALQQLVALARDHGVKIQKIGSTPASLEDAFVAILQQDANPSGERV